MGAGTLFESREGMLLRIRSDVLHMECSQGFQLPPFWLRQGPPVSRLSACASCHVNHSISMLINPIGSVLITLGGEFELAVRRVDVTISARFHSIAFVCSY